MFECPRCGKDCTNKSGLASHRKRCEAEVDLNCNYCNMTFSTKPNLVRHLTTCKKYKDYLLEEEHKKVKSKLENVYEEKVKELTDVISKLKKDHESELSVLLSEHKSKISTLKQEHIQDRDSQLKLRDADLTKANVDFDKLKQEHTLVIAERDFLKRKIEDNEREIRYLTHKAIDIKTYNTSPSATTNITNTNVSQVQNNLQLQLQMFDPSIIKGRIHPPDMMVSSVPQLVNHLFRLGAGNYFRVTDKSRYNTIWNKPGRGPIKDANSMELSNYIVDTLVDEIQTQQAHWEVELERLLSSPDPDMYRVNETQEHLRFCRNLLDREDELMKELQRTIVNRGKNKGDTSVDQVYEITYYKIINAIAFALLPHVDEWFQMSFYKMGRYLGQKIHEHYHTEGGSRENMYIVIRDDHEGVHLIYSEKLQELIHEALMPKLFHYETKDIIQYILTKCCTIKLDTVEQTLNYIETPTLDETEEIMRGIVSL